MVFNSPSKWNMLKGLKNIYDWYLILTFPTTIFLKVHAHYRHELVFFWRFSRPRGGVHYNHFKAYISRINNMYSLLFLDKYFLRNRAIWPRFVFDWYFLSRNPGMKIKEPGTSSSFVFLHLLHNISFGIFRKIKGDNLA
jgi:hypothetical protein